MQKIKKIFETIFLFIIIMLFICFLVSLYNLINNNITIDQLFSKTGLYFLYTIGYGALEGDALIQNILAIIGIVALALMSTFLTINLFWRLDDVKIADTITYKDNKLHFLLQNNGRTICNMQISFMLYDTKLLETPEDSKEYCIPIIIKKTNFNLYVDLNETFWYKVVYNLLTDASKKLYCIYSFVDTKNGQSSIKVEEFKNQNILNLSYEEFIKPLVLNCKDLHPIENGGEITPSFKDKTVACTYHFSRKNRENENFVMVYYNFLNNPLNLEKYNKNTTYFEFTLTSKTELLMTLEIKTMENKNYSSKIKVTKEKETVQIPFNPIDINLEQTKEICFTIFESENDHENSFQLTDLKICTK